VQQVLQAVTMPDTSHSTKGIHMHTNKKLQIRYGDGADKTVEENSSVFTLIRMH